jgi:hypothetical protein
MQAGISVSSVGAGRLRGLLEYSTCRFGGDADTGDRSEYLLSKMTIHWHHFIIGYHEDKSRLFVALDTLQSLTIRVEFNVDLPPAAELETPPLVLNSLEELVLDICGDREGGLEGAPRSIPHMPNLTTMLCRSNPQRNRR